MKSAGGVVSKGDSALSRHCCLLGHEQRHMVCTMLQIIQLKDYLNSISSRTIVHSFEYEILNGGGVGMIKLKVVQDLIIDVQFQGVHAGCGTSRDSGATQRWPSRQP